MEKDVKIVGAGVVGLILAKRLAAKGIRTAVYEQKRRVGYPVKASGILSIRGIGALDINYKKAVENELGGARIHIGKTLLKVHSEKPVAYAVDRLRLNEICYDEAVSAGAKVELGRRISESEIRGFAKESVVVGADGAVSIVAKAFGFEPISRYVLTYRAEYQTDVSDIDVVDIFVDTKITPGFFGWVAPIAKDKIEVAVGIDSKRGNSRRAFDSFVRIKEVAGMIDGAKPLGAEASIIPLSLRKNFVDEKKDVLLVGDAAGQTKQSTGGGIIFGGNAAIMAAVAIQKYLSGDGLLIDYQKEWMRSFGADAKIHGAIHWIYSHFDTGALGAFASLLKVMGIEGFLSRHGDMDSPKRMLKSLFGKA